MSAGHEQLTQQFPIRKITNILLGTENPFIHCLPGIRAEFHSKNLIFSSQFCRRTFKLSQSIVLMSRASTQGMRINRSLWAVDWDRNFLENHNFQHFESPSCNWPPLQKAGKRSGGITTAVPPPRPNFPKRRGGSTVRWSISESRNWEYISADISPNSRLFWVLFEA